MEDLVAGSVRPGTVDRAHDALTAERRQNRNEPLLVDGRVFGEIRDPVSNLCPGGRDKEAEDIRSHVPLL